MKLSERPQNLNFGERIKATNKIRHQKRIEAYYLDPKPCKNHPCPNPIPYKKQINQFCSQTCSTSYNNQQRSAESRAKQSRSLKATLKLKPKISTFTKIYFYHCGECGEFKVSKYSYKQ